MNRHQPTASLHPSFVVFHASEDDTQKHTFGVVQADGEVFVHRPGKTLPLASVKEQAVWVSLAEAQAYCRWAGGRIMSEGEYERAVEHTLSDKR